MYGVDVEADTTAFDDQQARAEAAPAAFEAYIQTTVLPALQGRIDDSLNVEPPPVKTPIEWTSDKQRRYVKWAQRVGLIPFPYIRTGDSRHWAAEHTKTEGGGVIAAVNPLARARFQFLPPFRQRFHANTHWLNSDTWAAGEAPIVADALVQGWRIVNGVGTP